MLRGLGRRLLSVEVLSLPRGQDHAETSGLVTSTGCGAGLGYDTSEGRRIDERIYERLMAKIHKDDKERRCFGGPVDWWGGEPLGAIV